MPHCSFCLVSPDQALLEQEKRNGRAREARHKLQVERMRQQLEEAQRRLAEQVGRRSCV